MQNKMKKYRKELGMTLDQLSDKSGVAKSTLSMIERGETEPMLSTAYKIAAALRKNRVETVFPAREY